MDSRECVIRAVEFDYPDRVPIKHSILPSALKKWGKKLEQIKKRFPSDFYELGKSHEWNREGWVQSKLRKGEFKDEWGCTWTSIQEGISGQVTSYPLASWDSLDTYQFPDPSKVENFRKIEEIIRKNDGEKYVLSSYICYFERMQYLRGFNELLVDLIKKPKELWVLADGVMNHNLGRIRRWLKLDVDGVTFGDDWGTQKGMMINPTMWREIFKPAYKRMFDVVHRADKHVFFHSDGCIMDIVPDLIECGVDVLNLQMTIMDIDRLGKMYGGEICFLSDLDRQHILPYGIVEDVKRHVKLTIKAFGDFNGGLIGTGEVGSDVPIANVIAMYEAFAEYGDYHRVKTP